MRADRLLQAMFLLQNRGKMTTKELAEELEVSKRTILRDMDALSASGIPIVAERGKAGGWKLLDRFRSELSGMKLEHLKTLFVLPSEQVLQQLGMTRDNRSIRHKLLASVPESIKGDARNYLEKVYIDSSTWKPSSHHEIIFQTVIQSLWEERRLHIRYKKVSGEVIDRDVNPLGIVLQGSTWYMVALSNEAEYRSYRLSRLIHAQTGQERFIRPSFFSLADYWRQSKKQFVASLPQVELKVYVHRSAMPRLTFTDKFVEVERVQDGECENWIPVKLRFNDEQEAIQYVLGFGDRMKLVEPSNFKDHIVREAEAVLKLYCKE